MELVAGVSGGDLSGTEDELGLEDARRVGRGILFGVGPPGQVDLTEDDVEKLDGLTWKKLLRRSELHHRKVCMFLALFVLSVFSFRICCNVFGDVNRRPVAMIWP